MQSQVLTAQYLLFINNINFIEQTSCNNEIKFSSIFSLQRDYLLYFFEKILKKRRIFVRWLDRVPRTLDFQAVKLTSEDSRRNQPRLST